MSTNFLTFIVLFALKAGGAIEISYVVVLAPLWVASLITELADIISGVNFKHRSRDSDIRDRD